jgi:hypothetical protein
VYSLRIPVTALVIFTVLFVLAFAPLSKADGVTYTFTGVNNSHGDDQLSVAFTYTAPGFLPPTAPGTFISLFPSQLDSCTNCLVSSIVRAVFFSTQGPLFGDEVSFNDNLNFASAYMFPLGAFDTPGTYFSTGPFNQGTLIVGPLVGTPEPPVLILLLIGMAILGSFCTRQVQLLTL